MNKTAKAEELESIGIMSPYVERIREVTGTYPTLVLKKPHNLPVRDHRGKILSAAFASGNEFNVIGTEPGIKESKLIIAKDFRDRELVLMPKAHVATYMEFGPSDLMELLFSLYDVDPTKKAEADEPVSGLAKMLELRRSQAVVRL